MLSCAGGLMMRLISAAPVMSASIASSVLLILTLNVTSGYCV